MRWAGVLEFGGECESWAGKSSHATREVEQARPLVEPKRPVGLSTCRNPDAFRIGFAGKY